MQRPTPNPVDAAGGRRSSSSSRLFSRDVAPARGYNTFSRHRPADYAETTKPFFTHSVPTQVVARRSPNSAEDIPRPVEFSVCDCRYQEEFIGSNLFELPVLRGCRVEEPPKGSSVDHSKPCSGSGATSLPVIVERRPLTNALTAMGRTTVDFRRAVEKSIPPFPFQQHLSAEAREEVKEYLRVCHAAHLFSYLSKDILRDRPAEPVDYIIEWLKKRRGLYGYNNTRTAMTKKTNPQN